MPPYREWDLACKVYVGNLGNDASRHDLEDIFSKYGPLRNVWVARNPPGFAFIEFEESRNAEDATRNLNGTHCLGTRIRVEMSSGRSRRNGKRHGGGGIGGGVNVRGERNSSNGAPQNSKQNRIISNNETNSINFLITTA